MRMTTPRRMVLALMLQQPDKSWYGYEISRQLGMGSGTIAPLLKGLQGQGVLASAWEDPESALGSGRPSRRYYSIPPSQVDRVRELLEPR